MQTALMPWTQRLLMNTVATAETTTIGSTTRFCDSHSCTAKFAPKNMLSATAASAEKKYAAT